MKRGGVACEYKDAFLATNGSSFSQTLESLAPWTLIHILDLNLMPDIVQSPER